MKSTIDKVEAAILVVADEIYAGVNQRAKGSIAAIDAMEFARVIRRGAGIFISVPTIRGPEGSRCW